MLTDFSIFRFNFWIKKNKNQKNIGYELSNFEIFCQLFSSVFEVVSKCIIEINYKNQNFHISTFPGFLEFQLVLWNPTIFYPVKFSLKTNKKPASTWIFWKMFFKETSSKVKDYYNEYYMRRCWRWRWSNPNVNIIFNIIIQ